MNMILRTAVLAGIVAFGAPAMALTNIAVTNASFETLPPGGLPSGCGAGCSFSAGSIPGWLTIGGTGQFQPGTAGFYNYVPDGLTVAYSNGGTIAQTVSVTAAAGATYTLTGAFGRRTDTINPGSISLFVGANQVVATGISPTPGDWSIYTASYTATLADVGSAITIVLSSPGSQGGFDNIILTAVPEPASWAMLLVGFGMVGVAARRRKATVAA
jgi:hypothetical protein